MYLALTAVLGGLLFAQPEGYEEAQRDVIRLSADMDALLQQQGYITCDPLDPLDGGPIEPVPLHCSLAVIPAQVPACASPLLAHSGDSRAAASSAARMQVNSEFQAFKHIQSIAPGELARATKPLEATLALQPTLILTNSLPCSLDVIVWQVLQSACTLTPPTAAIHAHHNLLCAQVAPFRKLRKQKSKAGRAKVTDFLKYDVRQMHVAFTGTVPLTPQEGGLVRETNLHSLCAWCGACRALTG